jgi:hypothetical protein
MSGLASFLLVAAFFFLMMRFGCGRTSDMVATVAAASTPVPRAVQRSAGLP